MKNLRLKQKHFAIILYARKTLTNKISIYWLKIVYKAKPIERKSYGIHVWCEVKVQIENTNWLGVRRASLYVWVCVYDVCTKSLEFRPTIMNFKWGFPNTGRKIHIHVCENDSNQVILHLCSLKFQISNPISCMTIKNKIKTHGEEWYARNNRSHSLQRYVAQNGQVLFNNARGRKRIDNVVTFLLWFLFHSFHYIRFIFLYGFNCSIGIENIMLSTKYFHWKTRFGTRHPKMLDTKKWYQMDSRIYLIWLLYNYNTCSSCLFDGWTLNNVAREREAMKTCFFLFQVCRGWMDFGPHHTYCETMRIVVNFIV